LYASWNITFVIWDVKMCHLTNSSVKRCRGINIDDFTSCLIDKQEVKRVIIKK